MLARALTSEKVPHPGQGPPSRGTNWAAVHSHAGKYHYDRMVFTAHIHLDGKFGRHTTLEATLGSKNELTAQFEQNSKLKGEQRFEIFDKRFLRIKHQHKKKQLKFALDMVVLDPQARHVVHYPWHWLGAGGAAAVLGLALLGMLYSGFGSDYALYLGLAALLALALAGLFAYLFSSNSERKYVVQTRFGQVPIIELLDTKANAKARSLFIDEIATWVNHTLGKAEFSDQELRAGELKTLRRLANEGAIAESFYEAAKNHILS